jgi:protein ImuB
VLSDQEVGLQRDYYRVETDAGERSLFSATSAGSGGRWWLHGIGEA